MAVFEPPGYFVIPVLRLFPLSDLAACSAGLGSGIFSLFRNQFRRKMADERRDYYKQALRKESVPDSSDLRKLETMFVSKESML